MQNKLKRSEVLELVREKLRLATDTMEALGKQAQTAEVKQRYTYWQGMVSGLLNARAAFEV